MQINYLKALCEFQIYALKCETPLSNISGLATLIVDDINDHLPEIYFPAEKETIRINEQSFQTLFSTLELYVEDLDLGDHATYEVILTQSDDASADYSSAFNIVPGNGYQRQSFSISVINTTLIDYEDEKWQNFDITVKLKFGAIQILTKF